MSLLKQKIEQVKQDIGYKYLSYLSIDLGYAHNYLGRVLSKGLEAKAEAKLIAKLDEFIELHKKELTHDFQGKALNTKVEDALMVSKSEYDSLNKSINDLNNVNADLFNANSVKDFQITQLKKELDHKTQVAEKHADMRAKAEADLQIADEAIKQQLTNVASKLLIIGKLEHELKEKDELINLAEEDSEKWQSDYWTVSRENVKLINSKRAILIWLKLSILIIVLMVVYAVLHFNGVV